MFHEPDPKEGTWSVSVGDPSPDLGLVDGTLTLPSAGAWSETLFRAQAVLIRGEIDVPALSGVNVSLPISAMINLALPPTFEALTPVLSSSGSEWGTPLTVPAWGNRTFGVLVAPNVSFTLVRLPLVEETVMLELNFALPPPFHGRNCSIQFWAYDETEGTLYLKPQVFQLRYPASGPPVPTLPRTAGAPSPTASNAGPFTATFGVTRSRVRKIFLNSYLIPIVFTG